MGMMFGFGMAVDSGFHIIIMQPGCLLKAMQLVIEDS